MPHSDSGSNLYLLHFPKINAIKIGKANNIQNRIDVLTRHWGKVDYDGSYFLEQNEKDVYKLERSLHVFLAPYKLEFDFGDGKEEMFKYEALEQVKRLMDIYLEAPGNTLALVKGVPRPVVKTVLHQRTKLSALDRFVKQDKEALLDFNNSHQQILKIHKLVHFWINHHERIKYQYSFESDEWSDSLKVTLTMDGFIKHINHTKLMNLFQFRDTMFGGLSGINTISQGYNRKEPNGVFAFVVQLRRYNWDDSFVYLETVQYHIKGLFKVIRKLPERSPLLTENILTEEQFMPSTYAIDQYKELVNGNT